MNSFLEAFFQIDKDSSEEITMDELTKYMRENNFKEEFVQKWLNIFDENKDGVITLDEFCTVLGLIPKEARMLREEFMQQNAAPRSMPSDVEIIFSTVTPEMELDIVYLEMDAHKKHDNNSDVAKFMKTELDNIYGPAWHCVIVKSQYWMHCTATPGSSFHFKHGQFIYLVWKTVV